MKSEERKRAAMRLSGLGEKERKEKSSAICDALMQLDAIRKAKIIFTYAATEREASLDRLNDWAFIQGKIVAYPVTGPDAEMDAMVPGSKDDFEISDFGIRAPVKKRALRIVPDEIDVVLVPCVAFDKNGKRLGHGKGYYDRYLPKLREDCVKILVAFDAQEDDVISTEETDFTLHRIVTESGYREVP